MAGIILDRELTAPARSRVRFALATAADDAAIRRLLRENPLRGEITVSLEREPDYFRGAAISGAGEQTILAFEYDRLVCLGRCSVRTRYLNGAARRVGYLGELRLDAGTRGRFDILRRGYQFFRELQGDDPAEAYFTSIAADNMRSIRFLERGLSGMPVYEFLGELATVFVPVPRRRPGSQGLNRVPGSRLHLPEIVSCLNSHAAQHQFAAHWTADGLLSLETLGLRLPDFHLVRDGGKTVACAALWDQRSFRQTVVRAYAPALSRGRPWINLAARWFGTAHLPPIGSALAFGFLSPLAVPAGESPLLLNLIESFFPAAAERGLEWIALGFAADDSRLAAIRKRFRSREYQTRLYRVRWDQSRAGFQPARDRLEAGSTLLPDLAFL